MTKTDFVSSFELAFCSSAFALDTLKKAAYGLMDRAAFRFEKRGENYICELFFDAPVPRDEAEKLRRDLLREVHDQDLRATISAETVALRNAILGYAFSKTSFQGKE